MNDNYLFKILESITAVGVIVAVTTAILYFTALPIFDRDALAWIFFDGLIAAAVAMATFITRAIWSN